MGPTALLPLRRVRPGLNLRTRIPEASTLTPRPPKPLMFHNDVFKIFAKWINENTVTEEIYALQGGNGGQNTARDVFRKRMRSDLVYLLALQ